MNGIMGSKIKGYSLFLFLTLFLFFFFSHFFTKRIIDTYNGFIFGTGMNQILDETR